MADARAFSLPRLAQRVEGRGDLEEQHSLSTFLSLFSREAMLTTTDRLTVVPADATPRRLRPVASEARLRLKRMRRVK